jgi:hypothetical protein
MANPIIKTSKCSSEGRIVALMFTKSQRGGHRGYWGFPLSGNCCFPLSHRDVEELLFVRGVIVSYEAIRKWCRKLALTQH